MAVWYDIIISLREFFRALPLTAAPGSPIRPAKLIEAGALNPDDLNLAPDTEGGPNGAVLLIRDREPDEQIYHGGEGFVVFHVENWTRSDDPDPAEGYRLLSEQEDRFTAALKAWATTSGPILIGTDIIQTKIEETIGDSDSRRPVLGSRKSIRVQWSKRLN